MSLPPEILGVIMHRAESVSADVTSAALTSRSLALAAHGLKVDIGRLNDLLPERRTGSRYCGGCHFVHSTLSQDWEEYAYTDYLTSAHKWLQGALWGHCDIYIDLRRDAALKIKRSSLQAANVDDPDSLNGIDLRAGDIEAAVSLFLDDWVSGRAWELDASFLQGINGRGKGPQKVLWCPTCRAQKVCEDGCLGARIENDGMLAASDITRDELMADRRWLGHKHQPSDLQLARKWLCKIVSGELKLDG